jgi:hypothetical protein
VEKVGGTPDFGWRSGSPLRLLHCFEFGFNRLLKNSSFVSGHRFSDAASSCI